MRNTWAHFLFLKINLISLTIGKKMCRGKTPSSLETASREKKNNLFLSTTEDKTVYRCKDKHLVTKCINVAINSFYPVGELYTGASCNARTTRPWHQSRTSEIYIQAHFSSGEHLNCAAENNSSWQRNNLGIINICIHTQCSCNWYDSSRWKHNTPTRAYQTE